MSSHDVFISYARGTARTEARALRDALDGRGRKVFLDEGEIPYGSEIPGDVAAGLVGSRVAVVFLDDRYLTRPFCIYELQVITALARSAGLDANGGTRHVVVAFPASGSGDLLVPYLPPSIANRSWPTATQTNDLASMIEERLLEGRPPLGELLRDVADDAVRRLRAGGQIPLPWAPADGARGAPPLGFVSDIPDSRGDGFVGREHDLWRVFDALVTPRAFGTPLGCTVYGPGGCGKSQLAAEFALRYGRRFFGGIVWIAADVGDAELADQFSRLPFLGRDVAHNDGAADDKERLKALQKAVAEAIAARGGTPMLWVVDGVPEPGPRAPPAPVQRWCPARDKVALLCTSRRAGIEGTPSTIELRPLTSAAAVTLLTRPPVDAAWLEASEWSELGRWVGELPLALAILRDSLTSGFATAKALMRSRGQEPAALLDSYVDALRGEVADAYVRGVAEAFELSYVRLMDPPELKEAAHLLARLGSSPIHEELAETLLPSALVGRLAKRSWIQAMSGGAGRRWAMHRIPASFLRPRSADVSAEYARLFVWLRSLVTSRHARLGDHDLQTHVRVIADEFFQNVMAAGASGDGVDTNLAVQEARAFAMDAATMDLANADLRALRYLAAGVARTTGIAAEIIAQVSNPEQLSDEAAANLPHMLSALPDSPDAAALMERLLSDARPDVRHRAIVSAPSSRFLSVGFAQLRAVLAETEPGIQHKLAASVDWILGLENPKLAEIFASLLEALAYGAPHERSGAASVIHRALALHSDNSTLAGHHIADIRRSLLESALAEPDAPFALEAAAAAGAAFDAGDLSAIRHALDAARDDRHRDAVIVVLSRYIGSAQRPAPPRDVRFVWDRDGSLELNLQLGASRAVPPAVYELLMAARGRAASERARTEAMQALAQRDGLGVVAAEFERLLDSGEFAGALGLADSFVACARSVSPLIANGHWWRAQALEGLRRSADAIAAYDAGIKAAPPEDPAITFLYERRAIMRMNQREFADALADLDRAVRLTADSFRAHHLRSLCLYNLERPAEAQAAADRALALDDRVAETWFFRGVARYAQGDARGTRDDLERAVALEPRDERATSFLAELRTYLDR